MSGFRDLLDMLRATRAEGDAYIETMDRVAGVSLDAAPVSDALTLRRANAATPVELRDAAVVRILGQMRAVNAAVKESSDALDSLSVQAEEISADVKVKVSKTLALILDAQSGAREGTSGTGYATAGELINAYNELLVLQKDARPGVEQYLVNQSVQQMANYFRQVFGQLGDIKKLAKEMRDYQSATAKKDVATGPSSGTLGRPKPAGASATSIAVLRWTGGLR